MDPLVILGLLLVVLSIGLLSFVLDEVNNPTKF